MGMARCVQLPVTGTGDSGSRRNERKGDLVASAAGSRPVGGGGITVPGADRLVWYFMRLSGVLLILLAGGHIVITHYLNVPSETTFAFVTDRWSNPYWRTFDWLLLMAALWHGVLGLRYSIQDYLRSPVARTTAQGLMWILGFVFLALGTVTVFAFDAAAAAANSGPLADAMWIAEAIGLSLYVFAVATYVSIALLVVWALRSLLQGRAPIYSGGTGQYAWALHRATGIGILFFLLVHIIDISLIGLGKSNLRRLGRVLCPTRSPADGDSARRRGRLSHPQRDPHHDDRLHQERVPARTCVVRHRHDPHPTFDTA